MGVCKKFKLLLWKNWLYRKRSKISTIFAIFMATLLSALLLYVVNNSVMEYGQYRKEFTTYDEKQINWKDSSNYSDGSNETDYSDNTYDNNKSDEESNNTKKIVYYTPDSNISLGLLLHVMKTEDVFQEAVEYKAVKDEKALKEMDPPNPNVTTAAISFVDAENSLPTKLHYRIRIVKKTAPTKWNTDFLMAPNSVNEPLENADYDRKFILLQHLIAMRFIEMSSEKNDTSRKAGENDTFKQAQFSTKKFPYPPYYKTLSLATFLLLLLPLFIIVSYIFIFPTLVKNIVQEKETGIKELMKLMGFSTWLQWSAWFVSTFIMAMIAAIIITILLSCAWFGIRTVLPKTASELFLLILLLYIASSISFCFFFCTFFSKPSVATSCAVIVMILTFFVPHTAFQYETLSFTSKMFILLLPNMALTWMLRFIINFEVKATGLQWTNLSTPSTYGDELTALIILGMFMFDTVFYWILAWYLDKILPSIYGIRKPWYFPLTKNYWCPGAFSHDDYDDYDDYVENPENFEVEPIGLDPLVEVVHLTKRYGRRKTAFVAVDDVTFTMYEGQITGLLGHNGAGKTTTMSMLTGMFPPTSGTAYINGFDIRSQMDSARKSLGLCPQHNMLFDKLTCREHLKFFGGLKIANKNELNEEIDSLLLKLQLSEKRNVASRKLSGGMKRKLNLGIALIGHPKVVMLDEPTSGLDPEARRAIWDVIQEHREGSCIVLSTHFMDEADALADRIAIMANGQLVCCGSPGFLKTRFGAGYHLHIVKHEFTNVNKITGLVNKHIKGAYLTSDNNSDVSYVLPADQTRHFANFFRDLEFSAKSIGVTEFGLSVSTVEDVFLKVGEEPAKTPDFRDTGATSTPASGRSTLTSENSEKSTGISLKLKQIIGLILKRWYYAKRRWSILIFQIFLPALIIFLGLKLGDSALNFSAHEPPLVMDLAQYGTTTAFLNDEDNELKPWYALSLPSKSKVIIEPDPEQFLQQLATSKYQEYVEDVIVGAVITDIQLTAWYNGLYYHTEPLSLNILHNAILKYYTDNEEAELVVENWPYPVENVVFDVISKLFQILMIGIYFPLAISFLSSSFVIFPIHERATMCKQLQMMTGVGGILFWGMAFLWDFLIYTICAIILLLVIFIFDSGEILTADGQFGLIFLLLLLYGWSSIPFAYVMSLTTKVPATGFTRLILISVIFGMVLSIVLFVASYVDVEKSSITIYYAVLASRFLPSFAVTFALMKIGYIGSMKQMMCTSETMQSKQCSNLDYYKSDFPGIMGEIYALIITGIVFFAILALYELKLLQRIWDICGMCFTVAEFEDDDDLDSDVAQEKARVYAILRDGEEDKEVLLVTDLTKTYGTFNAVRGLNFALEGEECFGLIGVNGAGKTTTFQMLAGNLIVTKGNAYIYGISVRSKRSKYLKNVGYCPQFDPLIDYLSGREMLIVFAYLRGISRSVIKEMLDDYIENFDLQDHARKITRVYSGGNKRKLSVALAFIGDPPVVFLDEPTTGVDPVARRKIRDVLGGANRNGMCVVLTSHSMEECEALCDRVGIMVQGQFRCFGGIQYLKNKFSEGYVIFARLKRLDESKEAANRRQYNLQRFIESQFPSAKLTDVHEGLVQYQVYDKKTRWADMFEQMEKAKSRFNLEDYTVSQTSLDQVFLSFAREE